MEKNNIFYNETLDDGGLDGLELAVGCLVSKGMLHQIELTTETIREETKPILFLARKKIAMELLSMITAGVYRGVQRTLIGFASEAVLIEPDQPREKMQHLVMDFCDRILKSKERDFNPSLDQAIRIDIAKTALHAIVGGPRNTYGDGKRKDTETIVIEAIRLADEFMKQINDEGLEA